MMIHKMPMDRRSSAFTIYSVMQRMSPLVFWSSRRKVSSYVGRGCTRHLIQWMRNSGEQLVSTRFVFRNCSWNYQHMPSARHHNEWLSLIEVSGPFLSVPVLDRVFPHGLDKDETPEGKELVRNLRLAFDEWEDDKDGERPNPAIHKAWIDFVIKQGLGLPDEVLAEGQNIPQTLKATIAEHGET